MMWINNKKIEAQRLHGQYNFVTVQITENGIETNQVQWKQTSGWNCKYK